MNVEEPQISENVPEEVNPQTSALRDELIRLSAVKEIKYSEKYIKKASQGALEKIKQDHQREQMDKVNSQLTETFIAKFSELMEQLDMVKNDGSLDKELSSNKLLYDDVKTMVMKISPFIPMIGLLSGGLILAKHMWNGKNKDDPKVQSNPTPSTSNDSVNTADSDNGGVNTA